MIESSLDRDKFMSPEEALDFGLIDKILEHPPKGGHEEKSEPKK
jgi:ATP-dependent Clp protease protease subunit